MICVGMKACRVGTLPAVIAAACWRRRLGGAGIRWRSPARSVHGRFMWTLPAATARHDRLSKMAGSVSSILSFDQFVTGRHGGAFAA